MTAQTVISLNTFEIINAKITDFEIKLNFTDKDDTNSSHLVHKYLL